MNFISVPGILASVNNSDLWSKLAEYLHVQSISIVGLGVSSKCTFTEGMNLEISLVWTCETEDIPHRIYSQQALRE